MRVRLTKEIVNERLKDKGIRLVGDYTKTHDVAEFECDNGHRWEAMPRGPLNNGNGCPHCAGVAKLSIDAINERLLERGIKLIGPLENTVQKAKFRCSCGFEWVSYVNNVLHKTSCPKCAKHGFDPTAKTILYYIRFDTDSGTFWKIGVTNRTPKERFKCEKAPFEIIKQWEYETGAEALAREKQILSTFWMHRYNGPDILSNGNKELFTIDVLDTEDV